MARLLYAITVAASCSAANAASLIDFEVIPDGSRKPPGDKLTVRVLFGQNEAPVDIQVRAYLLPLSFEENDFRTPILVRAKTNRHRAADGSYSFTATVAPNGEPVGESRIVVEYSDLSISIGRYKLAYELQARRNGTVLFSSTSDWTRLVITEEPRPVEFVRTTATTVERKVSKEILVPSPDAGKGFLKETVDVVESAQVFSTRSETVENPPTIDGGFYRPSVYAYQHREDDVPDELLSGIDSSNWTPKPKVRIHFATNRNVVAPMENSVARFGNEVSVALKYGTALVNIPVAKHEQGQLELPKWYQRENPEEHFFIESLVGMSEQAFNQLVERKLSHNAEDVLVMVHGYRNSMKFALLRTAQVQHDIHFPGSTVLFAWPSEGSVSGYWHDETAAGESIDSFVRLLRNLFEAQAGSQEPGKVHLIAHSIGNRILLDGLAKISEHNPPREGSIGHVVLAAPDVDHNSFLLSFPLAARIAESMTMYFCKDDKALLASQTLHNDSRIGQVFVAYPPLINIDAERANTSILGHDYFASRSPLLIDLEMHFVYGHPAERRPTLRKGAIREYVYWLFP